MKKLIMIFLVLLFFSCLYSVIEETASLQGFIYGSAPECEYDNWMSHITEGIADPGYNLYAPWDRQLDGFGNFVIPDTTDLNIWGYIIDEFLLGDLDSAQAIIDTTDFPYQVVIFHDTDSQRTFHMLREIPNMSYYDDNDTADPGDDENGAFDYGWGLYIYYPAGNYPHITTAPHPCDDYFTIPIAHKTFIEHESKFVLISGAGREVVWTNSGNYSNSKSLCDPSRVEDHPFNVSYQKFCDLIRSEFGRHEFSLQIHSYDWGDRHWGYPSVQISGGYYVSSPDLPIRDFSSAQQDIVSASGEIIHNANTIGMHSRVHLNDFYGFHCSQYDFNFSNPDTTFAINTSTDLWGYSSNRQIVYTHAGMNQFDNFERFLHLEMDELPNQYPQTTQNYHWFHGWDAVNLKWDMPHRFYYALEYYSPWIMALKEVLPQVYQMNDNQLPAAPTNLEVTSENSDHIRIGWTPGDCFDMATYEILYSTEPIGTGNYSIIDNGNYSRLSCLAQDSYQLNGLQAGDYYYFAVRIKDKQGNISDMSNEVMGIAGPAYVYDFRCVGEDLQVSLYWKVNSNSAFSGFNLYRREEGEDFTLLSGWETNPELVGMEGQNIGYTFIDNAVENGEVYTYKLATENNNMEYFFGDQIGANPQTIYEIFAAQLDGPYADTCYFGYNKFASNGYDQYYDIAANDTLNSNYLYTQFYEQYWNNTPNKFSQQIEYLYDPVTHLRSWVFRLKTDQIGQTIEIGLNGPDRDAMRIYLYANGIYTDLQNETYLITPTNSDYYYFTLYLGNITPNVDFGAFTNRLFYPNETIEFNWSASLNTLIDHMNTYVQNEQITIPVELNMNQYASQTTWTVPQLLFEDLQFRVDLVMTEGDTLTHLSPYRFGIVSPQTVVQTDPGWQMRTHHLDAPQFSAEDIYGTDSEFFLFQDQNFSQVPEPDFLQPFWLYAPQANYCILNNASILQNAFSFQLEAGWNLVPNPHKANYRVQQLIFTVNNIDLEYYQAVQNGLIEPNIFAYDQNFVPQMTMQPGKSYYLYAHEDDVTVKFVPYNAPSYDPEFPTDWEVEIFARTAEDRSAVCVGTFDSADSLYDANYDLLKPSAKPFAPVISFYLPLQDPGAVDPLILHRSITSPKDVSQTFLYVWEAELELPEPGIVEFSAQQFSLPADHNIYLQMPQRYLELSENNWIEYEATENLLQFQILVTDQTFTGTPDELLPSKITLKNYPNPFNPETTISFSLSQTARVKLDIFNIRGQKVCTLHDEITEPGRHNVKWKGVDNYGRNVASGVYFYRLAVQDNPAKIRKMLLLK